jgi:hypothetical protein
LEVATVPNAQAFIPVARGQHNELDERLRAPDQLTKVYNGTYLRDGAISKRNGFTALATSVAVDGGTVATQGTPKGLLSDGTLLMVRGFRSLYSYDSTNATWRNRGILSPCTISAQEPLWHDQYGVYTCDAGQAGNYLGQIAVRARQRYNLTASSGVDYLVSFSCVTTARDTILQNFTLASVLQGGDQDHVRSGARIVGLSDRFKLFWQEGRLTLKVASYTPGGADPAVVITASDRYSDSAKQSQRYYDACAVGSAAYCYAYVETVSNDIKLSLRNASDTQTASATLSAAAAYSSVGIFCDAANSAIYVACISSVAVEVYSLSSSTLATNWGPVVLDSLTSDKIADAIGVTLFTGDASGTSRVVVAWTVNEYGVVDSGIRVVAPNNIRTDVASVSLSGISLSAIRSIYNCHAFSKPFQHGSRCYLAVNSDVESDTFGGSCLMDITTNGTAAASLSVAASYNFGRSPGASGIALDANQSYVMGSLQSVYAPSASAWSFAVTYITASIAGARQRLAADRLTLDFAGTPMSAGTSRGCSILAGGNICWFSGAVTEELGWYSSPIICGAPDNSTLAADNGFTDSATAFGTLTPGVTYTYQVVIETYDDKGNYLRSVPGPARDWQVGAGKNTVFVTARVDGLTSRSGVRQWGSVLYRAAADGVFRRCLPPLYSAPDDTVAYPGYTRVMIDDGTVDGAASYTQGGAEVEAAAPDGATIVCVGTDRVFLGGFGRADRVAYSKRIVAAAPNEDTIGPEFNDAFSLLLPHGERCTGIAELDDKLIVFSESAIYAVAGEGPDDGGKGAGFSPLTRITSDTGCTEPRSVVVYPGGVMFLSAAGIYSLGRGLDLSFIGAPVRDELNANCTITSAVAFSQLASASHVRFTVRDLLTGLSGILVYDYTIGQGGVWAKWTPKDAAGVLLDMIGGCIHQGVYHVLASDGKVYKEDSATWLDAATTYVPLTVATSWLQAANQSGLFRTKQVAALCARKNPHALTVKVYQDFETTESQSFTWSAATIATQAQPAVREYGKIDPISRQKCTAVKFQVSDASDTGTTTGQGYTLAGFTAELMVKRGLIKTSLSQRN